MVLKDMLAINSAFILIIKGLLFLGPPLALVVTIWKCPVNWGAVASIATLTAVALWPIYSNALKQREIAKNLRFQILTHLTMLRPIVARRFTDTGLGPMTSKSFDSDERKPINALELAFSQAHMLTAKEHNVLGAIILNLSGMSYTPNINAKTAKNVLELIDRSEVVFQESKYLRGSDKDFPSWVQFEEKDNKR